MTAASAEQVMALGSPTSVSGPETFAGAGENMAAFMALRGWPVVEAAGCWWHGVEGRFFMSLPYHLPQDPDIEELNQMLRSRRWIGVRFPSVNRPGLPSGLYVCRRKDYGLPCVDPRQRSRVRRGLEALTLRLVEKQELLGQGLQLNTDTMARQGRYDAEFGEPARWRRFVKAAYSSPGVAVYGAFFDGHLAAYAITCRDGGWLHLMHQYSRTADLCSHPNHALTFWVTSVGSEDRTIEGISYGLASLISGPGLHEYKLRFGYEFLERTSVFHLNPLVAPVFQSRLIKGGVSLLRRAAPSDQRLQKFESICRGAHMSAARLAPPQSTEART